ncbi:MAG: GlsB/YeaQ/YmgE family stress response membrane protein [Candidatus Dormibacteria bacterium]
MAIHHLFTWLVIGLIAGALAGRLVRGRGLGCLLDIVVGLAGAVIGGLIIHQLDPSLIAGGGFLGLVEDVVVAFLGSVILLCVVLLVSPRRGRRRKSVRV